MKATFPTRCLAAAPRWSRASTAAGTRCARCPTGSSPACGSSCSSPTGPPTACPATTTAAGLGARAPDIGLPEAITGSGQPTYEQPAYSGALRHADRQPDPTLTRTVHGHELDRTTSCRLRALRLLPLNSFTRTTAARHPDVISVPDRRANVNGVAQSSSAGSGMDFGTKPLSRRRVEHQQRGAQSRRDHRRTRRATMTGDYRSASTRSAWASSCDTSWAHAREVRKTCSCASPTTRVARLQRRQLEGKYYFAQTEADVGPAFQALQSQIVRLSK